MGRNSLTHQWGEIIATVSQEKWERTQVLVAKLADIEEKVSDVQK